MWDEFHLIKMSSNKQEITQRAELKGIKSLKPPALFLMHSQT